MDSTTKHESIAGLSNTDPELSAILRHLAATPERHREDMRRFLESKLAQGIRTTSLRNYSLWVSRFLRDFPHIYVAQLEAANVVTWLNGLRAARHNGGMVEQASVLVKAFVGWLLVDVAKPKSFWLAFRVRSAPRPNRQDPPSPQELACLIDAVRGPVARTLVATLASSGMRISELLALNVGSVRFEGEERAWLDLPEGAPRLKTGPRDVPIATYVRMLKAYVEHHPQSNDPRAPLFFGETQRNYLKRLKPQTATRLMTRACARANLRHFTPHDLRHYRATVLTRTGVSENAKCRIMGWVPGSKTAHRYTHLTRDDLMREAAQSAAPATPASSLAGPNGSQTVADPMTSVLQSLAAGQAALTEVVKRLASP